MLNHHYVQDLQALFDENDTFDATEMAINAIVDHESSMADVMIDVVEAALDVEQPK